MSFLKTISIKKLVDSALTICFLMIILISALGWFSQQAADQLIQRINQIGVNQSDYAQTGNRYLLNAVLDGISVSEELQGGDKAKISFLLNKMNKDIAAAEEFFAKFKAMPALNSSEGQALVHSFEAEFSSALTGMLQANMLLQQGNRVAFNQLRADVLNPQLAKLGDVMEKVFLHVSGLAADDMNSYTQQLHGYIIAGISVIAAAFVIMLLLRVSLNNLVVSPLADAVIHLDGLARAELTQPIRVLSDNEMGRLQTSMLHLQENLTRIVGNVRNASAEMMGSARQIATGNADLAARTEQQASSLEQTAASMEELTSTVQQNADNARQANGLAAQASGAATQGRTVVNNVIKTMQAIAESSRQVTQITNVIDSIAFQTNILALNASVEAARAGDQGRGFAVVANEVRSLASRSAEAAREIKGLIDESGLRVQEGMNLAEDAGTIMVGVVDAVQRVSDIFDEISAASQEQSQGIGQVNTAVTQLDQVTQQNASLVQTVMTDSHSMTQQARQLEEAVAVFRIAV